MKLMLVTRDLEQRGVLTAVFRERHHNLTLETADSALFALTLLEYTHPDLIVSAAEVGLSGADFLEIVRDDPSLQAVAFILLDETALGRFTLREHEAILDRCASPEAVAEAAARLLDSRRKMRAASNAELHRDVYLQGVTELVSPFELAPLLARDNHTGRLTFALPEQAVLCYRSGELVHAEYRQLVGEEALVAMFRVIHTSNGVFFDYRPEPPSSDLAATWPVTLHRPLELLLLEVALELDRSALEPIK